MKPIFSVLAGIIFTIGYIPYIIAILKKGAKPAKASWVIWLSLDMITIASMFVMNTLNGQMIGAVIGAWIVVILAFKYGAPGWTLLDKLSILGAIIGIVIWQLFDSPLLGILINLGVTFIGSIPTFISAWEDPGREDKLAWILFLISCICALIAVPDWDLANAAQPITFFVIEATVVVIIFLRKPTNLAK
ncbi:hypothetical protein JXE04_01375 [Patescibacteria group bacterium]|nr:hypothetical protein [Patescibacteria group bacterium]